MKKCTTLLLLLIGFASFSQAYYNFVQKQATYTPLGNNALQVPYYQQDPRFYLVTLPAPIKAFGQLTNTDVTIGSGFLISTTAQYSFAFDPFIAQLADTSGGVYMEWDTLGTEKHLYVEWRNFKLQGHPVSDFVHFKIDFNLENEVLEFHYGPSRVTDTAGFYNANSGPQVIATLLSPDFSQVFFYNALEGAPANPTHHTTPVGAFLNAVPPEGTVYRFEPINLSLEENKQQLYIYPNPVVGILKVENVASGTVTVQSIGGKELTTKKLRNHEVDLSDLPEGIYILKVSENGNVKPFTLKIVKQ